MSIRQGFVLCDQDAGCLANIAGMPMGGGGLSIDQIGKAMRNLAVKRGWQTVTTDGVTKDYCRAHVRRSPQDEQGE